MTDRASAAEHPPEEDRGQPNENSQESPCSGRQIANREPGEVVGHIGGLDFLRFTRAGRSGLSRFHPLGFGIQVGAGGLRRREPDEIGQLTDPLPLRHSSAPKEGVLVRPLTCEVPLQLVLAERPHLPSVQYRKPAALARSTAWRGHCRRASGYMAAATTADLDLRTGDPVVRNRVALLAFFTGENQIWLAAT